MQSIHVHKRLKMGCRTDNLVDRSMGTCEMLSVCEEVRVGYNRNNMLVHMAKLVVRISEYDP